MNDNDRKTSNEESEEIMADTETETAADPTLYTVASTAVDLARLGLHQIAYVRRAMVDDQQVWSIHNAAGDAVGAAPTQAQAWAAIVQSNLLPVSVH